MATTDRWHLPFPAEGDPPDGPEAIEALAVALDGVAMDDQGPLAGRPVSTVGTAGKKGRYYMVKGDSTAANNGVLWRDNGNGWDQVGSNTIFDTKANRPNATSVPSATRFFATDQIAEWISDGTQWIRLGAQPGEVAITLAATATAGKVFLQGQAWPSTTGIYADLYALYGGTHLPDFTTRVPVGFKAGDASFGALVGLVGEKTHVLTQAELPSYNLAGTLSEPSVTLPVSLDGSVSGGALGALVGTDHGPDDNHVFADAGGGITVPSGGSGNAHNNIQPSIVVNFEAKL